MICAIHVDIYFLVLDMCQGGEGLGFFPCILFPMIDTEILPVSFVCCA